MDSTLDSVKSASINESNLEVKSIEQDPENTTNPINSGAPTREAVDDEQTTTADGSTEIPPLTPGRAKLHSWLYKIFRIVLTDGRVLNGAFLCTDSDANIILGMCSEDTQKGGEERMLGLVMVPGRHIVSMEMDASFPVQPQAQYPPYQQFPQPPYPMQLQQDQQEQQQQQLDQQESPLL